MTKANPSGTKTAETDASPGPARIDAGGQRMARCANSGPGPSRIDARCPFTRTVSIQQSASTFVIPAQE